MAHPQLLDSLGRSSLRSLVVDDAVQALEGEVGDKSGLGGMALKAAFAVLKGTRPAALRHIVDRLLDDFLVALQPTYEAALDAGLSPGGLVEKNKAEVARALVGVADKKAAAAGDLIRKTYEKLRPTAEKNVEVAAPRLAALLDRHAPRA